MSKSTIHQVYYGINISGTYLDIYDFMSIHDLIQDYNDLIIEKSTIDNKNQEDFANAILDDSPSEEQVKNYIELVLICKKSPNHIYVKPIYEYTSNNTADSINTYVIGLKMGRLRHNSTYNDLIIPSILPFETDRVWNFQYEYGTCSICH